MTDRDPPESGTNGSKPGSFPTTPEGIGEGEGARLHGQTPFDSAIPDPAARANYGQDPPAKDTPHKQQTEATARPKPPAQDWEFDNEELPARLSRARERARSEAVDLVIIALIGFSGTGKSFIIRRLIHHLKAGKNLETRRHRGQTYVAHTLDGRVIKSLEDWLDRTTYYSGFWLKPDSPKRSQRQYLLLDLPGEQFNTVIDSWGTSLATRVKSEASDGMVAGIGGALAFADALIFTPPAMQLLDEERYLLHGDIEGDDPAARKARAEDHAHFFNSMQTIRDVAAPLRLHVRAADAEANLGPELVRIFRSAREAHPHPLDLPARLLLTRGDEYLETLPESERATFDADALAHIASRRPDAIERLANQFMDCAWDFATPCAGTETKHFDPARPHHGVARLLEWVDSAVDASRRRQTKGWPFLRPTTHDALRLIAPSGSPLDRAIPAPLGPTVPRAVDRRLHETPAWARLAFMAVPLAAWAIAVWRPAPIATLDADIRIPPPAVAGWTGAEARMVRGLGLASTPVPPPAPPAQSSPPPNDTGLLGMPDNPPGRRANFLQATSALADLAEAEPGRPGCAGDASRRLAETSLPAADSEADGRPGMISYHLGLLALCQGDTLAARGSFIRAGERFAAAAANPKNRARLPGVQHYHVAALYGAALAAADWPARTPLTEEAAEAALAILNQAEAIARATGPGRALTPTEAGRCGSTAAFPVFGCDSEKGFEPLRFATANILAARLWIDMRTGDGPSTPDPQLADSLRTAMADSTAMLANPAALANASVFTLAAGADPQAADAVRKLAESRQSRSETNPADILDSPVTWQERAVDRFRAMALLAGARVTTEDRDWGRAEPLCRGVGWPAIRLAEDADTRIDDPDSGVLDRASCLAAMRRAAGAGDITAFLDAFRTLRGEPGAGTVGAAATDIARSIGPAIARNANDPAIADAALRAQLNRALIEDDLFPWWQALPARLRLAFGTIGASLLWALVALTTSVWFALLATRAGRLDSAVRNVRRTMHHEDRVLNNAPDKPA